jgi:3'-phosphoadenosine 5'-phosphosulfate sulfotransferase (PAPS reductase)/FAD synthetase
MGLSGGKDSTALAILLHKEIPEMEYFFCDTHRELPETYEYLDRIKAGPFHSQGRLKMLEF